MPKLTLTKQELELLDSPKGAYLSLEDCSLRSNNRLNDAFF